jgi:hypothetical protein
VNRGNIYPVLNIYKQLKVYSMDFDPTIALSKARKFSRPRQVGSSEEVKVAQEIACQLEQSGFVVNFQTFQFSTALERFLSAEILAGQVLILTTILTSGFNQWSR